VENGRGNGLLLGGGKNLKEGFGYFRNVGFIRKNE